jgi:high-affinity iron transporter
VLSTAIIVFREILEASLIVGVVMAASRGAHRRGIAVGGGIAGGLVGAILVAIFAGRISDAMEGVGQEIFNAAVLLVAVVMLGWHNIWMKRHGREMARQMADIGAAVRAGGRPVHVLAIVVGAAVLREGAETVLFLYGIAAGTPGGLPDMALGGGLGIAAGVALGTLLYRGLLKVPPRHLFQVTGWMILLMAAGMASQASALLVAADLLPPLGTQLWDTSALLDQDSILGRTLHTLIGYEARPAPIQLVFFAATLGIILMLMRAAQQRDARPSAAAAE